MVTITEDQVKEAVNRLIDLKEENNLAFTENEMFWRRHGIELAINIINGRVLNELFRDENKKHELSQPLLKTA